LDSLEDSFNPIKFDKKKTDFFEEDFDLLN